MIGHLAVLLGGHGGGSRPHHDLFDLSERQYAIARLLGVAKDDLRQTDFMFDTPQFVEGVSDYGSWYIFA